MSIIERRSKTRVNLSGLRRRYSDHTRREDDTVPMTAVPAMDFTDSTPSPSSDSSSGSDYSGGGGSFDGGGASGDF